jgi:glutamine synthetase
VDSLETFRKQHPDLQYFDLFYGDLCGVVRGKRYPADQLEKVFAKGAAHCGSVFLLSVTGENMNPLGLGFSDGDPDELASVIPGTLAPVPWANHPTAQAMMTLDDADGTPYYFEPRNVLRRVSERFDDSGLKPVVAFELEFYLIDPQRTAAGFPQAPKTPSTDTRATSTQVYGFNALDEFQEYLADVARCCELQNVKIGAITSEYAPGQFEINLNHANDLLRAADECVMFKRAVQGVARKHGVQATFMPKPYIDHAGSGLHLHLSLYDGNDSNVFDAGGQSGDSISDTMRHATGGLLQLMPEYMAVLAPSVNSFRRFQPNLFVPTQASWGFENRSTAIRIPTGDGASRRIEHRVAGADANPYLALAAILAGIHHGINNKINPGEPWQGNACETRDPNLPFRLQPALDRLAASAVLKDYLGERYVQAYTECKQAELEAFEDVMTTKEYGWYLQT